MHTLQRAALLLIAFSFTTAALADEGMWTYDNFPTAKMQAKYGWAPDAAWLEHARLASIRLTVGCSASLVSSDGLVMTNHHCARECVSELADAKHDYIGNGFYAATLGRGEEMPRDGGESTDQDHRCDETSRGGDRRQVGPRISRS